MRYWVVRPDALTLTLSHRERELIPLSHRERELIPLSHRERELIPLSHRERELIPLSLEGEGRGEGEQTAPLYPHPTANTLSSLL